MKTRLPALAALLLLAAPAAAKDLCKNSPKDMWLTKEQIRAKVAALGYDKARLEVEDGCYEAKVTTKDGKKLEIYLEPTTGEVVKQKGG